MPRIIIFLLSLIVILNLAVLGSNYLLPDFQLPANIQEYVNGVIALTAALILLTAKKTKTRQPHSALKQHHKRFFSDRWIVENIPHILCIKDSDGHWLQASPVYLNLLGLDKVKYQGKTNRELSTLSCDCEKGLLLNAMHDDRVWKEGKPYTKVENFKSDNLDLKTFEITKTPVFDSNNRPYRLVISGSDMSVSKKKLHFLQLISSVFNHNPDSILILDLDFRITLTNPSLTHLTGYTQSEFAGSHVAIIAEQKDSSILFQTIQTYIGHNPQWEGELTCKRKNNTTFPAKLRLYSVINRNEDKPRHYIGTLTDITEQKAAEQHYLRLAHYDDLTDLPNRVMFINRLNQVLSRAERHHQHAVLLFIDLDHFKSINDTVGHQGGDELLVETARRLTNAVRNEDTVARLSGDEFAILLHEQISYEKASYAASLIANKVIATLTESFYIQKRELFIGASIGIAIYPEDATNSQDLLKFADIAMYQAKNQGRNNYQFFKRNLILALKDRHQMETEMRKGLEQGEFRLYYQPQYDAQTKQTIGAEVLVRWFKSNTEEVPVYSFIPLAEESGLIVPLGQWILETACKTLKQWLKEGYPLKRISVNISAKQFAQPDFLQMIEDTLDKTGLDAACLELEITESMLMGDIKRVLLLLQRLHNMGISLAIDDFGTGYSSLSYLKDFPIDILKIDQSFVRGTPKSTKDSKIVCAIIEMGHSLGLKIVAEGVETEPQLIFLNNYECDYIQGYYFSKPIPENEMTVLLQNST